MKRGKKPKWQLEIAKERIKILFSLAKKEVEKKPERAKRYIELARKISLRYNIRLSNLKRYFCKKCNMPLIAGKTSLHRLDSAKKTLNIICKNCGNIIRIPYKDGDNDRKHKH
ncbi:MAG: ribonuclease P [Candidatus Aenigmatarchaeota archaeon]